MSKIEKDIISMYHELRNPRNDGWVQESNLSRLLKIESLISSLDLKKEALRFKINSSDIKNHIDDAV